MRHPICIRLPAELIVQLDHTAGPTYGARTAAIEAAIRYWLAALSTEIHVVCMDCGCHKSGPVDAPADRTSHGLCDVCAAKRDAQMDAENSASSS